MGGLFGGGGQTTKTSDTPLSAFQVQSSAYGLTLTVLYGRNRISGNMLWYGDFQAIAHTTTTKQKGGKGGGGSSKSEHTSYTYSTSFLLGLGEGPIHSINAYWADKEYHPDTVPFTHFLGSYTQTPWSYQASRHPGEALAYRGTAYVAAADYDLGDSSSLKNHNFDVTGRLPFSPGVIDGANPRDIIADIISNDHYGIDGAADYLDSWLDYSNYCVANGIFLSPIYSEQAEARQHISELIEITNSGIYFSEGKVKIVPYSDAAANGNGAAYSPVTTAIYDLDDDDYLDAEQPIRVLRTPNQDAYNQVQIEYLDRYNQYNEAVATAQDQASIELYGLRPMDIITAKSITDAVTARQVAQLILQRVLYSRNTYEFKLGWKYARLEPCDYVTLTDARLGLNKAPVRILSIEESEDGELSITAEDAPAGILSSPLYDAPAGEGYIVNFNVPPGPVVAPAFFEVPPTRALSGLAIGVAVTGASEDWGGAEIWVSNDGDSYANIGSVYGGARYGTIGNTITHASDQVAHVTLAGKAAQMYSGSVADANNLSTLCLIDNEFVAHTTATLAGANAYNIELFLRALYGTAAAGHAAGARIIRVDDAIVYSDALELSMISKTLWFKFASFNKHGGAKQALADVAAYPYTITGSMAKLPPPALVGLAVTPLASCNMVTWTNPAPDTIDRVEVWASPTDVVGDAVLIGTVRGPVGTFTDYVGAGDVTRYYWVRSINLQGFPSAYLGPESGTTGTITVTLPDGSVTTAKLAEGAVTGVNIGEDAISAEHLAANSITAAAIATDAILTRHLASDQVTADKIRSNEIQTRHLTAEAVTADKIDARGLSIKDADGNIILGAGKLLPTQYVSQTGNINLLDTSSWTKGHGAAPGFNINGGHFEQWRTDTTMPDGSAGLAWMCYPGLYYNNAYGWDAWAPEGTPAGDADGGWNTAPFPVDPAKTYRFSVFVRRFGGSAGSTFLGCGQNTVRDLNNGAVNGNPYFYVGVPPVDDTWYLAVGYVYPSSWAAMAQPNKGGLWSCRTGQKIANGTDFAWVASTIESYHRAYLYYSAVGSHQYLARPRVDLCDGSEPSIDDLLSSSTINGRNPLTASNISTYIAAAAIDTAYIRVAAIDTLRVAGNAVTVGVANSYSGNVSPPNTNYWVSLCSAYIHFNHAPYGILVVLSLIAPNAMYGGVRFRVYRNGVEISELAFSASEYVSGGVTIPFVDAPVGAGGYTYTVQACSMNSGSQVATALVKIFVQGAMR